MLCDADEDDTAECRRRDASPCDARLFFEQRSARATRAHRAIAALAAVATAFMFATRVNAQAIQTPSDPTAAPWNVQRIFDPTPLPMLTDADSREELAPEDTPVKTRQQPGYEPIGIRAGSWLFSPSLITGGFYDSNVFSTNTQQRSDIAAVFEPSLRARTMTDRAGMD